VGWTIRPVRAEENDGFDVMFDIHFERNDDTPFDQVLCHPLSEEVDDYKAYKCCSREQRDAEKHGTLRLGSLNYRATSEMNLSERDFQQQFRRPSAVAKDRYDHEKPKVSRTPSVQRPEVVGHDFIKRHYDGSNEENEDSVNPLGAGLRHAQSKRTAPKMTRGWERMEPLTAPRNHGLRGHCRNESYYGGSDDAVGPPHPGTQIQLGILPSTEQGHIGSPAITTRFGDINWNPSPRFYEVDWNPPPRTPPGRQHRISNVSTHVANVQSFDGTSEPTCSISSTSPNTITPKSPVIEQTGPVRRGVFEAVRGLEATPKNAFAYLRALDLVWFDIEEAEFVDRVVHKDVSIDASFVEHFGGACRRQWLH
jgi:hypothetical protein